MGPAPRVECRVHGVVVSRVPWAEPGSRFTRDFEMECTWLMTVANRKTVSGFLHVCLCSMVLRPVERLVFSPKER